MTWLTEPWLYWASVALVALLFAAIPLAARWEDRSDRKDLDAWDEYRRTSLGRMEQANRQAREVRRAVREALRP